MKWRVRAFSAWRGRYTGTSELGDLLAEPDVTADALLSIVLSADASLHAG
jgi:hypothetical protein